MSTDTTTVPDLPAESCTADEARLKSVMESLDAVRVSDIESREQHWLWPGRIPLGDVTLLVGDPGVGKSLLALDLAARVTRGMPWPDAQSPSVMPPADFPLPPSNAGSVILFSAEDTLAETVRPRLMAAGADCSRIVAIRMSVSVKRKFSFPEHDAPENFELRRDLRDLWRLVHATPDCRLVVIDSINSCLSENSEQIRVDDWGLLLRLVAIARQAPVALVIVSHLRKKGGRAICCNLGSLAFAATARAVWAVAKDPESAERRLFVPVKNNLADDTSGLAFTIESGSSGSAARIRWSPEPVSATADTVVSYSRRNGRPDDERKHAKLWLRERLASGPRTVKEIRGEADVNGFSPNTLRRAFRELGGKPIKESTANGPWLWRLPVEDTQNPLENSRERIEDAQN